MANILPYRPARGYGATLNGDAQLEDTELQDADLTQPGVLLRGPGARELPARVHESGGTESMLDPGGGQALFWRPDVAGDELCMVHEDTLYTSKPTEVTGDGTQAWRRVGTWAPWTLRQQVLHQPLNFVFGADVATIRDSVTGKLYHVAVWEQRNTGTFGAAAAPGVYAIALDESGAVVAPATLLASGIDQVNPRACACETGVVIVWGDTTGPNNRASAWLLSNPVEFTGAISISVTTIPGVMDVRRDGPADRVLVLEADGSTVRGRTVTPALVNTFIASVATTVTPSGAIALDVDPLGGYLLTWSDGSDVECVHVDGTFTPDTTMDTYTPADTIVRVTGCHVDGVASQGTIAVEQRQGAVPSYRDLVEVLTYDGTSLASERTQRGASLWGHGLVYRGRPLAWVEHWTDSILQEGVQILTDLLTGDVLARAFPRGLGRADDKPTRYAQPSTPHLVGQGLYQAATLSLATITSQVAVTFQDSVGVTRVDGTPQPRNPATVPGYVLDAHAGIPWVYDGREATEADWHVLPTITVLTPGAGGSLTPSSTYVVAVTYRHVARNGDFWRSAPYQLTAVLGAGHDQITVGIVPCRWTARETVLIEVWVSLADAGFPLYLDTVIVSDPTVDGQIVVITDSDATHESGGVTLDQFEPAAVLAHGRAQVTDSMVHALGRFWSPDPQRPDIVRHTIEHDISRDGFGWGWEGTQLVQLDTSARPQAAGDLEGNLAVFAGSECHLVHGLGPDKQGAGLFGQTSKFGVVDLETSQAKLARVPDSAVPGGLAYATPRGLYLLRRDRVSQGLSVAINRLFRFDGVVPQALAYEPERGQLWLMTLTAEARSHRFSLLTGRWCGDSVRRAQDVAVSVRGEVAWLMPDSSVRIQDGSMIADGTDDLLFRGETPTLRIDPANVGQPVTVQALLVHVYVLVAPAVLDVAIVDAKTGEVIALNQQVFAELGPQSRATAFVNLATSGHRVRWSQPAGDEGRIVVVELDSQVEPSDGVLARTVTPL